MALSNYSLGTRGAAKALAVVAAVMVWTCQAQAQAARTQSPTRAAAQAVEVEVAFDYAMAALQAGQPAHAIPVLQSILAQNPTLIRVRLELARAYFMAEQWARSRDEFFRVLSGDLPDPVRQAVLAFIRQIDARRGVDWDLNVALTTVGNSRAYDSEEIDLLVGGIALPFTYSRPVERLPALQINGSVNFRHQVSGLSTAKRNVVAFTSLGFDLIDAEGNRYDDQTARLKFGLRMLYAKTTASIAPFLKARRVAGKHYEDQMGLEAAFERRSLLGGAGYGGLSFATVDNHIKSGLDGRRWTGLVGFRRSVGGRNIIGTELAFERRETDDRYQGFQSLTWSAYSSMDLRQGWTLRPRVFVRYKDFLSPSPAFVGNPNETSFGAALRVEKSDVFIAGSYTPYVQVDVERGVSDISAFSYRSVGLQIGLERRF